MPRFLQNTDYDSQIKEEIRRLLDGRAPDGTGTPVKLLDAETKAISQMRKWLSHRYDCDKIFIAPAVPDARDPFLVMTAVDMTLYHLYSQTAHKDVPDHRSTRYQDALDWLKAVNNGAPIADLPIYEDEDGTPAPMPDMRLSSDAPPENYGW